MSPQCPFHVSGRDQLKLVMPARPCGMTVAVLGPAQAGEVSLPGPTPSAGSRSREVVCCPNSLVQPWKCSFQRGRRKAMRAGCPSRLSCCEQRRPPVSRALKEMLYERGWWEQDCMLLPPLLLRNWRQTEGRASVRWQLE